MTTTLPQYLHEQNVDQKLVLIICAAADACVNISTQLARLPILTDNIGKIEEGGRMNVNVQGEVQKPMDVIANEIFITSVKEYVAALASEEEEEFVIGTCEDGTYEIAFDPLDGSSNLDVSVPTGTIFGIAPHTPNKPFSSSGRALVAAGYAVYSSSVDLVISLGPSGSSRAAGFTLDPLLLHSRTNDDTHTNLNTNTGSDCFILSRPNMNCPNKGQFYSLNDGREPDWPQGLQRWIYDAKRGQTPSGITYSSRYICSLCADVHRTLIKGGWAGNPRPHLRLLYEAAPLSHVAEACGARGSSGTMDLLDIVPTGLHDRTSVFIGSTCDIAELEEYGDVQQPAKKYTQY